MNDYIRKAAVVFLGIFAAAVSLEIALTVLGYVQERRSGRGGNNGAEQTILCLGDSFVFGVGAPRDKSFPAQLEGLLNAGRARKAFRVINAGVQGQNTAQLLEKLPQTLAKFRPRVVVLLSGGSNVWNYNGYYRYLEENPLAAFLGEGISRIRVYKLAKLLYMRLKNPPPQDKVSSEVVRYGIKPGSLLVMGNNPATAHLFEALTRIDLQNYYSPRLAYAFISEIYKLRMNEAPRKERERIRMLLATPSPWNRIPEETINCARRAQRLFEAGDNRAAAEAFAALIRFEPGNLQNYHTLALVYMRMGKWEEAFNACKAGILAAPEEEHNRSYEGLVYLHRLTGRHDERIPVGIRAFLRDLREEKGIRNPTLSGTMDIMDNTRKESASDKVTQWMEHDLRKIVETCRAENIFVLLLDYPENNGLNTILIRTAKACSVPVADVYPVFSELLRTRLRGEYFIADGHCNADGYGIMASAIYKRLLELKRVLPVCNELEK